MPVRAFFKTCTRLGKCPYGHFLKRVHESIKAEVDIFDISYSGVCESARTATTSFDARLLLTVPVHVLFYLLSDRIGFCGVCQRLWCLSTCII